MNIPIQVWQAVGAITAAMVAGFVSFIVTVLSKEQKTSEFRQAWIDSLRQDISDYVAGIIQLTEFVKEGLRRKEDLAEITRALLDERFSDLKGVEQFRVRILLRLNPSEHQELITLIERAYIYRPPEVVKGPDAITEIINALVVESQRVLKKEWRRVKRGERVFFITKWSSLIVFVSALAVAVWYTITAQNVGECAWIC